MIPTQKRRGLPSVSEEMRAILDGISLIGLGIGLSDDDSWVFGLLGLGLAVFQLSWWVEFSGISIRCRRLGHVLFPLINAWRLLLMPLGDLC